jgi:hypothetical protein
MHSITDPFPEEFSKFLSQVCQNAAQLLHAQASSVFLKQPEGDVFMMRAAHGYSQRLIHRAEYRVGEGITGWVAEGHQYMANSRLKIASDPHHIGKYDDKIWKGGKHQCHSMVAVPLYIGNQVHGLIKVENKRDGKVWKRFTGEDLESLSIFLKAISHAIESNFALMSALGRLYVFVLMPFHKKFDNVFKCGIEPAVREAGMRCVRIDLLAFTDDIMRRIYECIAKADIVISVTTGKNANVFYETGYSHALGKPTIPLAEKEVDIPFDLRHYPHIIYSRQQISELKTDLQDRLVGLRAAIKANEWPGAPPSYVHSHKR